MTKRMLFGLAGAFLIALAMTLSGVAWGQDEGDVNGDGQVDVADVQGIVNDAVESRGPNAQNDVDGNGRVDIFDVQNAVNTALGIGGLVQRVTGRINYPMDIPIERIVVKAVSGQGEMRRANVNLQTGRFMLPLRVRRAWTLAAVVTVNAAEGNYEVGQYMFKVPSSSGEEEEYSPVLPIPRLSRGKVIALGEHDFARVMYVDVNIFDLLARVNNEDWERDRNENGIPDFIEPLLERVRNAPGVLDDMDLDAFSALIANCIEEHYDSLSAPSRVDENENGVPDFLEPFIDCLRDNILQWFEESGVELPEDTTDDDGNGVPDFIDAIVRHVVRAIPEWLQSLNEEDLEDENGNGMPDYIEEFVPGPGGPNPVDTDGDGTPNYLEDDDGDGVPNYLDEDEQGGPGDADGDGIPDPADRDDDNDGIPDYADPDHADYNGGDGDGDGGPNGPADNSGDGIPNNTQDDGTTDGGTEEAA